MLREQLEQLKQHYTDQYVVVCGDRADLARFRGAVGRVKTVNCNGRALVQFDVNNDRGWYDIAIEHLTIVDAPPRTPSEKKTSPGKPKAPEATPSPSAGSSN